MKVQRTKKRQTKARQRRLKIAHKRIAERERRIRQRNSGCVWAMRSNNERLVALIGGTRGKIIVANDSLRNTPDIPNQKTSTYV